MHTMPKRTSSQPIQIPEIPPFRKRDNQHSNYPPPASQGPPTSQSPQTSTSASPPQISDIPPYKPRKSKDLTPTDIQSQHPSSSHHRESQDSTMSTSIPAHQVPEHQITIGPTGGAEWARRLKVAEQSPIHRSTDCIVSKQELGTSSDSELLLKPAPSWSNVALKTDQAGGSKKMIYFIF